MTDLEVARYGIRTFRINNGFSDRYQICSTTGPLYKANHWEGGKCEATCLQSELSLSGYFAPDPKDIPALEEFPHPAPYEKCTCGIYACLSLEHLWLQYEYYAQKMMAIIAAEGTTYLGTRGLRTQYARVVAFWAEFSIYSSVVYELNKAMPDAQHYISKLDMIQAYGIPEYMEGKEPPEASLWPLPPPPWR